MANKRGRPLKYVPFYEKRINNDIYQIKTDRNVVKTIIEQELNRKTIESSKGDINSFEELVNKDLRETTSVENKAQDLAQSLIEIKQYVNHPIEYSLNEAKKTLGKEYEAASIIGDVSWKRELVNQYVGIDIAKNVTSLAIRSGEIAFNRYTNLQEDYLSSQTLNNAIDTVNRTKSLGSEIFYGIKTGSIFGPAGALAGAAIGAINFGANQYLQYQQRMSSYYQQLNSTNFQTEFASSRMGLINNSRGTEN